jgi:hypothetical protein
VLGYALTLPGTPPLIITNQNPTIIPRPVQFGPMTINPLPITERVLVADAIISMPSQKTESQRYTYDFSRVTGGSYAKPHTSAHLKGKYPIGGNQTMMDGHVQWMKFDRMQVRGSGAVSGDANCPTFWW